MIVIVVYQQIENYILQPTIIGKAAQVSSFTVLVSVLAFGALFGLIGAVIAVPIAAGIQIVVEEFTAPEEPASPPRSASTSRPDGAAHTRCEPDRVSCRQSRARRPAAFREPADSPRRGSGRELRNHTKSVMPITHPDLTVRLNPKFAAA